MNKQFEAVEIFNSIPEDFLVKNTVIGRYTDFDSYIKTYDADDWKILKQELIDNPTSSLKEIIDSMWVNYDNDIKLGEVYYHSSGFDEYVDCLAQWGKETGLSEERIHELCDAFSSYVQNEWKKQHMTPEELKNSQDEVVVSPVIDAILVERNYKGQYERFALTPEEFKKEFPETVAKGNWPVKEADTDTIAPMVHIWFEPCWVGDEEWNDFFTDMALGLPESDIEAGNFAYIREDLFQSLREYLPKMENIKDNNYPNLSSCDDFEYLKENLSEKALDELERIIDAYVQGKINIEIVRDENEEIRFEESFNLIVNDKEYEKSGFEALALKWYESFEDTGFFVEWFSEVDLNSYCYDVDFVENGKLKSFQVNAAGREAPDSSWLVERISHYLSSRFDGDVEKALRSVEGIDVQVTDFRGEYVDSDEVYGDDLKALFEHLKTERYKIVVDDEIHYAMLTKYEVNRIQKDIAGELNCQFEITSEKGEKIESGIIDFIEKDEKPRLDAVISEAKQKVVPGTDKQEIEIEPER